MRAIFEENVPTKILAFANMYSSAYNVTYALYLWKTMWVPKRSDGRERRTEKGVPV